MTDTPTQVADKAAEPKPDARPGFGASIPLPSKQTLKNLLLALLAANILYFLWGMLQGEDPRPGVEIVEESDLGPPLSVALQPEPEVGAVLESVEPSQLTAAVGRSCVTLGPFRSADDADEAEMRYAGEGMQVARRSPLGRIFVGHWVQIRDVPSRQEADRMLDVLREGGLGDAYFVQTEDEGMKISLGVFGVRESAERVELEARSLDLPAEITPRFSEGTIHFVDLGLPSGRGAGEIVERYGEEMVMLRDKATCPE